MPTGIVQSTWGQLYQQKLRLEKLVRVKGKYSFRTFFDSLSCLIFVPNCVLYCCHVYLCMFGVSRICSQVLLKISVVKIVEGSLENARGGTCWFATLLKKGFTDIFEVPWKLSSSCPYLALYVLFIRETVTKFENYVINPL